MLSQVNRIVWCVALSLPASTIGLGPSATAKELKATISEPPSEAILVDGAESADLGRIPTSGVAKHSRTVTNGTTIALKLKVTRVSCPCVDVKIDHEVLEPGQSTSITLTAPVLATAHQIHRPAAGLQRRHRGPQPRDLGARRHERSRDRPHTKPGHQRPGKAAEQRSLHRASTQPAQHGLGGLDLQMQLAHLGDERRRHRPLHILPKPPGQYALKSFSDAVMRSPMSMVG